MCMACNNRVCGVCRRRFGEHRVGDDACPGEKPGAFANTTFKKWKPSPAPVAGAVSGQGGET